MPWHPRDHVQTVQILHVMEWVPSGDPGGTRDSWNQSKAKGEGEKERYTHLNAAFQRIARRDKKAFLSDQWKEIEENNRMEKTRDVFKKTRDAKGTLHAKRDTIKDRNGRDLTEAEDIKKRWQEYTEEWNEKDLHDPDNHDAVITHLEPDILECKVKWALGSIIMNKASGGDGIPVELLQILKDDAVKVLHSTCQQIWKTQQWPQDWKRSVFIPIPKKGNAKEYSNYCTVALISHTSKVRLKILQAWLQQYMNHELPDVQAGFRKGRVTRDWIANIHWIIEKARVFQKNIYFCFMPKPLTVWITTNWKILKEMGIPDHLTCLVRNCMQLKKQQLELDMEQRTCLNWERSMSRLYIVTLLIWLICRVYNEKCWAGWSTSWNHDCQKKYQSPQICRWHHPYGKKQRGTKVTSDESERGGWKSWLKTQHSKNEDHGIRSYHFMANRWGNSANSVRLYFLGLQNHCRCWLQPMKLKDAYSLDEKLWPT